MERRKQIEIEDQEIKRKEKELIATIKLPAEAEGYKVQTLAEGNRSVGKPSCIVSLTDYFGGKKIVGILTVHAL